MEANGLNEHMGGVRRDTSHVIEGKTASPLKHIAIIGMSGRFPGCENVTELWDLLQRREDVHEEIPPTRFPINVFYDPSGEAKNSVLTRYGCFLSNPGHFDARFFNISPREAAQMDPLQRMFLMTTHEALEMAGYNVSSGMIDKSRISTYFGQSTDDWKTINDQQGIQAHYLPATNRSFAPGRVNHHFKWGGGSYSIDTGCSSSATAIHLACGALLAGECDMSVVGGGNICVIPEYFSGFSMGSFLSPTGGCKPFDERADGYCRGEAVGCVVLKRLDDAVAANDKILGVIAATARNSNAGEGSITYPGEVAQVRLFEELLERGGTRAEEVGYVEMHGTGTQAGDFVEMNSVRSVLARTSEENPLYVGALKANIGHGEAAAGISSLIKGLLMLQHDKIPGQPRELVVNERFQDLAASGIHIAKDEIPSIPRSRLDGKRKLLINSFDAAGGNTSLLLQDSHTQPEKDQDSRTHHIVATSGTTAQGLVQNKERLRKYLEAKPLNLADLAYTTTARRKHHPHREAYVVESIDQLLHLLPRPRRSMAPTPAPLVFVFTGQSSQYTGMGATLYKTSPRFRSRLEEYNAHCTSQGLASFLDIIQGTTEMASATAAQVQLAMVALEIALAHFLQDLGLKPTVVIGHSIGEYSALCVAGVLSVSDALYLVHERAVLMEKYCVAGDCGMMAVPLGVEEIRKLQDINTDLELCCLNSPSHSVIGGSLKMFGELQALLSDKGITATQLRVPYAFHTGQMDSILPKFKAIADKVNFGRPILPVASTLTGEAVDCEGVFNSSYLVQQCRQPVNFMGALTACAAHNLISQNSLIIEIGPHPACTTLARLCLPHLDLVTLSTLQRGHCDWETISECLATAYIHHENIDWEALHDEYIDCVSLVTLPAYAFNTTDYWTPYRRQAGETIRESETGQRQNKSTTSVPTSQYLEGAGTDQLSDISITKIREQSILDSIQGHVVDGVAICPASVYLDMAYRATQTLLDRATPAASINKKQMTFECVDLEMTKPLTICEHDPEQTIHVAATSQADGESVTIQIVSTSLGVPTEHAACRVVVCEDTSVNPSGIWPQVQRLVQRRVDTLSDNAGSHRMASRLMYKLFDSIVEYSSPFRVLENIIVEKNFQDAIAEIQIPVSTGQESSNLNPFLMDALVHLPGFLLNCNLEKAKDEIHIAKCIGQVLVLERFWSASRSLTLYATISSQDGDGTTFCDAYLFHDGQLAACVLRICFQKITRQIFRVITGTNVAGADKLLTLPTKSTEKGARNTPPPNIATPLAKTDLFSKLMLTVASATGIDIEDVNSATSFEELGVDSHIGISVIAEFNKATGMILPAAFFNNFPTLRDAERELIEEPEKSASCSELTPASPETSIPTGRAILLQGNPNSTTTPLFLVTESSGSVAVYTHFPPLPDGTPIYALESPFLETPERNTLSLPDLAKAYIATMRTVQPNGPYLLGGYSFAAVYAYEMAYQLALRGERLLGLVIIDMYVPPPATVGTRFSLDGIGQGPLANITTRISGLFPKFTDNQKVHMGASMRAAECYTPVPIPAGMSPVQTHLIWATRGVNENGNPEEFDHEVSGVAWMGVCEKPWGELTKEEMSMLLRSWFFAPRVTFGDNGWESLVGGDLTIHLVDADHLSMVAPPKVLELGKVIAEAVGSCV
ncbi:hypothetical protein BJX99DRAFT_258677 [Aspergillus californicus]